MLGTENCASVTAGVLFQVPGPDAPVVQAVSSDRCSRGRWRPLLSKHINTSVTFAAGGLSTGILLSVYQQPLVLLYNFFQTEVATRLTRLHD